MMAVELKAKPIFRPRARMILLLGDQLIRDAGLAVFELVKNAYDADASKCVVTMQDVEESEKTSITVVDDGTGMSLETVKGVWLEPGTDHRQIQFNEEQRTKRGRLPLGEKGVGRFAAHKLGHQILVITRAANSPEVVVSINWHDFETKRYLSDVPISIKSRQPMIFTGRRTGTRIQIMDLRETWSRGKIRDLYRSVTSICSPFRNRGPEDFEARLVLEPSNDWLDKLIDVKSVLEYALFRARGNIEGGNLSYKYAFTPLPAMQEQVAPRKSSKSMRLMRPFRKGEPLDISSVGTVEIDLYVFDREPKVLELITSDKAGLKKFLDQNGGIRIYRDGVRVFDFGEPGNDWLDLGGRRVNIPTLRISNNQMIGAVSLSPESRASLVEKTNREGFIENEAYEDLRHAILFALSQIEAERRIDKERLRKIYSRGNHREPVLEDLATLRVELEGRDDTKDLVKYIDRIDKDFSDLRDRLMTAAGAGLTLTTVIHEVEKIVKELLQATIRRAPRERLDSLIQHLAHMVDGLAFLARNSGNKTEKASALLNQALFNTEYRLRAHDIHVTNGVESGHPDFSVRCSRRLIVSTLMNLLDNSIYWLENKGAKDKQIYVGTTLELGGRPALIVADNGPGFIDEPEYLVQPFFTRKPDGMGLGLHLANEVAKLHKGSLQFPDAAEIDLPKQFTGAIVAIAFPKTQ